jgi:two-component system nitrate/nitrite response regulator NarL
VCLNFTDEGRAVALLKIADEHHVSVGDQLKIQSVILKARREGTMKQRYSFATVLVGKNSLRKEGIAKILRSENIRILASLSCADDLFTCKDQACQLLFLIVHTGDDFGVSVEQIELLNKHHPDARIAVVADHYQLSELDSAFRAGAAGYFVDVMSCDAFIKSIELVMMGEAVFPPAFLSNARETNEAAANMAESRSDSDATIDVPSDRITQQLSPREKSILRCLIEGDSNKCIARKIDIAEATVKVHVKAILRKIGVQNRTQAAIWGMNNRFLVPMGKRPPQLSSAASERSAVNFAREIPELKRIQGPITPAAINRTAADDANTRIVSLSADGSIQLRK